MFDQFTILARKIIDNEYNDFYYLTIDPGLSNIGWCITSFKSFELIAFDRLSLNYCVSIYNNDLRIKIIFNYIQDIIIKYNINIVCIEKITFSSGKYSFAEQSLLKAIGVICAAILCEDRIMIEINNRKAQLELLGKARSKNKQIIFDYVYSLIANKLSEKSRKKIFTKSKNDICDAIFLAYAFRYIITKTISD